MVAREREEKTVMHLREMASIALMHVTPNGVKYPSGSVKPALRWFFEGNFRKLSENTKERHKGELRARKPARASPVPRPRVSSEVAIFLFTLVLRNRAAFLFIKVLLYALSTLFEIHVYL